MKKPKIVVVGHVCIDHNTVEHTKYTNWGSSAMYMTKYIQKTYGVEPKIIASYGQDFAPYAAGVSLYPPAQPDIPTLVYENIVKDGKRTQFCHHNEVCVPPKLDARMHRLVSSADILFLAPLTPAFHADYVSELLAGVRTSCLKVLLPQGYLRNIADDGLVSPREFDEAGETTPQFNLVILSDEDHPDAINAARSWKKSSPQTEFIVTRNANGADIIQANGEIHIPTTPVPPEQIVDSVGSGDVFGAATAFSLYDSADLPKAIETGHAAARQKLLTAPT